MSMHGIPLTAMEEKGAKAYGYKFDGPSQLTDAFRQGIEFAQAEAKLLEMQSANTVAFNGDAKCSPTATQCPRCNNPWNACDQVEQSRRDRCDPFSLKLDGLLAALHEAVWNAATDEENPVDYDMAGVAEAKAIQAHVDTVIAQPAGKDAWLVEAERLAQLHACEKSLRHLGREDADETKTLAALLAHLRSHPAAPEGFVLVPVEVLRVVFNTLSNYANEGTYQGERTGGVLAGCPREPKPTPSELTSDARIALRHLEPTVETYRAMIAAAGRENS